MAAPTFQKGDRVAFKESPEVVGKVVALWKGNFYRVAWDSGLSYQGNTTIQRRGVKREFTSLPPRELNFGAKITTKSPWWPQRDSNPCLQSATATR